MIPECAVGADIPRGGEWSNNEPDVPSQEKVTEMVGIIRPEVVQEDEPAGRAGERKTSASGRERPTEIQA